MAECCNKPLVEAKADVKAFTKIDIDTGGGIVALVAICFGFLLLIGFFCCGCFYCWIKICKVSKQIV